MPKIPLRPVALLSLLILLSGAAVLSAANAKDEVRQTFDAHSAFEHLKSLEGTWKGEVAETQGGEGRETEIVYEVSAAGHSVIQTFSPGKPHEMFSVYHMDGDELLMTHYCAIGNAPKMKFKASGKPGEIVWEFAGGTNFDPAVDAHAHEGSMKVVGPDEYVSQSIGMSNGKTSPPRYFTMKRE